MGEWWHKKIDDECYTPEYAVRPIVPYLHLHKFKKIWCPFDTADSEYVKVLQAEGFDVVFSHKDTGVDFFDVDNGGFFAKELPGFACPYF